MVFETVSKDILDKLNAGMIISGVDLDIRDLSSDQDSVEVKQSTAANLKAEVINPPGTGIRTSDYGSTDGGSTWVAIKVDVDGHLQIDIV